MALGTESIEPVQKIVGPGNVYVTSAKMILSRNVEIDFPAGPSQVCVLADLAPGHAAVPWLLASIAGLPDGGPLHGNPEV